MDEHVENCCHYFEQMAQAMSDEAKVYARKYRVTHSVAYDLRRARYEGAAWAYRHCVCALKDPNYFGKARLEDTLE